MNRTTKLSISSIGKKVIMSITGLFLCLFLVVHLIGNLQLFKDDGGVAFNAYSEFMSTSGFIRVVEFVLLFGFLFHIIDSLVLTIQNRAKRPIRYTVNAAADNSSWVSRNMGITGSIVLIFLVVHLRTFFVKVRLLHSPESMYEGVKIAFANPFYSAFYVVAMVLLGLHLSHGFQSSFQSLGLSHLKYTPFIEKVGVLFSVLIPVAFASLPIYFYFSQLM